MRKIILIALALIALDAALMLLIISTAQNGSAKLPQAPELSGKPVQYQESKANIQKVSDGKRVGKSGEAKLP